jgi:hypothetical protein
MRARFGALRYDRIRARVLQTTRLFDRGRRAGNKDAVFAADGMPKVKLNPGGRSSSTASNCSSNGSRGIDGKSGGDRPSLACASVMISSIGCGSMIDSRA